MPCTGRYPDHKHLQQLGREANLSPFGCPDTTTYGQVITVPSGMHHLNKFTFWWESAIGSGPMVVRAYVYKWDGANVAVQGVSRFESPPRTTFGDGSFHPQTFYPGIAVTPGVQYVMFASIDREYVDCKNSAGLGWGYVASDAYPGGPMVYQNNAGDDLQWTASWTAITSIDFAFKAYLSP